MQGIEADAVGAEPIGKPDEIGQVGEVAYAPIARRANAVKLGSQQPAAVKLATKRPLRRRDQRYVLGHRCIFHLQPIDAERQIRGPVDGVVRTLAFGDNPRIRDNLPLDRKRGEGRQFGPRRPPGANHHGVADQRPLGLLRQGIEDDFQRGGVRHTAVTLTVQESV